ncbi:phage tail assembly chaperone [Sporosarcina sp. A2]|uniref:phage tail assembly chaperone n=1 Tax=Sporosarcina sp. A2 TaxID=3393449 RepID=UPI003D7AE638
MANDSHLALEKWLQRDVKATGELELPHIGLVLELEALDWKTTQNLIKKNTIPRKGGPGERNTDGFTMDMIAKSLKKVNGEPFNLYQEDTLSRIGVKTHEQAINKLFTPFEIGKILQKSNELSGATPEVEEEEVEELKN